MTLPDDNVRIAVLAERVFDGRAWHERTAVLVEGERILALCGWADVPAKFTQRQLPKGAFLAPGFIDLQVNGGGGILFNDDPCASAMQAIARVHRRFGTTALVPTLITDTWDHTEQAIDAAHTICGRDGILGLHLEGPFLNPARAGVHRRDRIRRAEVHDLDWLCTLGQIGHSLVTLAPESVPDGFIRALVQSGVRVSIGHSEASAAIVGRAVEEGATGVTHLFNAMPPLAGRAPGVVGAALAEPRLVAGLIADGLHVDPVSLRAAFAAKGTDGIALVSDAMPTVGSNRKTFDLMGHTVTLRNQRLVTSEGVLAGAHLDMASAVRNAVTRFGIPLDAALRAATLTPARFLGVENAYGCLAAHARADMVALSNRIAVLGVWAGGVEQPPS